MGLLFSLLATVLESGGKTVDKLNFRRNGITYRQMLLLEFAGMALLLVLFMLIAPQTLPSLSLAPVFLMVAVIALSFAGNVYDEISLKADDLSLREPMVDFEPILAGLVGYLLFPGERKPIFLAAFLVSAVVVYWGSHRRKLRKFQSKGLIDLLIASLFYAFLPSLYKEALMYFSPVLISAVRSVGILLLLALFLRPRSTPKPSSPSAACCLLAAAFYATEAVVALYAIKSLGVVLTMLIFMLGPFLRYLSSYVMLREKVRLGEVISSMFLVLIVVIVLAS